jgi:hypothetical protein
VDEAGAKGGGGACPRIAPRRPAFACRLRVSGGGGVGRGREGGQTPLYAPLCARGRGWARQEGGLVPASSCVVPRSHALCVSVDKGGEEGKRGGLTCPALSRAPVWWGPKTEGANGGATWEVKGMGTRAKTEGESDKRTAARVVYPYLYGIYNAQIEIKQIKLK